jgi:hypothetical protein
MFKITLIFAYGPPKIGKAPLNYKGTPSHVLLSLDYRRIARLGAKAILPILLSHFKAGRI